MATERQIEANRRNAALSSGPRTEQGKAASRTNAVKHGMACESIDVEAARSPAYQARRVAWSAEFAPIGEAEEWALDRLVAASFRIERCERTLDDVAEATAERAALVWDQDRALDAARLGARLASNPSVVARKLEATRHGVELMLDCWTRLGEALETVEDWTESQAASALDLLGVPPDLRSGRTPIDGPDAGPSLSFRRKLVADQVARLDHLCRFALVRLDELERSQAISGGTALLGAPARLILRYEREAWRRYRESLEILNEHVPVPAPVPTPLPAPVSAPAPPVRPVVKCDDEEFHNRMMEKARSGIARMIRDHGPEAGPSDLDVMQARASLAGTKPIEPRTAAILHHSERLIDRDGQPIYAGPG